jgi:hypothetical protein
LVGSLVGKGVRVSAGACSTWASAGLDVDMGVDLGGEGGGWGLWWGLWWDLWWGLGRRGAGRWVADKGKREGR